MLDKDELMCIASALGFEKAGICRVEPFTEHYSELHNRVQEGLYPLEIIRHERALQNKPCQIDPSATNPSMKSIIVLAYHYYFDSPTDLTRPGDPHGVIARNYMVDAYGEAHRRRDELISELMKRGVKVVTNVILPLKQAAISAGIGWQGKHSLILNKELGSWLVLQSLLIDQEMEPDEPQENRCGGCKICSEACPTGAIKAPGVIDVSKCIDFLTCKTGEIQSNLRERMANRIISCDRCQEACPYNRRPRVTDKQIPKFDPRYRESPALLPLLHLSESEFIKNYSDCDIMDNNLKSFKRNVIIALGNLMDPVALKQLDKINEDDPVINETRDWAIDRIRYKNG